MGYIPELDEWDDSLNKIPCAACSSKSITETENKNPIPSPEPIENSIALSNHSGPIVTIERRNELLNQCIQRMQQDPTKGWASVTEGQALIIVLRKDDGKLLVFDTDLRRRNT